MFYHRHKFKDMSAQNNTVMTNVGITRVKNKKKNTIHYKVTGTYYITTSTEMDEQYLSIQYKSNERTMNDRWKMYFNQSHTRCL